MIGDGLDIRSVKSLGDESTPLHHAAIVGNMEVIKLFQSKGIDINVRDGLGQTPLHVAAAAGRLDSVQALLGLKATINPISNSGEKPIDILQRARSTNYAQKDNYDKITKLLSGDKQKSSTKSKVKPLSPTPAAVAGGNLVGGPLGALALGLGAVALVGFGVREIIKYTTRRREVAVEAQAAPNLVPVLPMIDLPKQMLLRR